jgi:CheY-like chemotaxis protein
MGQINYFPGGRARMLFVDDDLILAEFAKVHLASSTVAIDAARNGEEAWRRLCEESYDLVLLDIEMPILDGFALLERLRTEPRFENLPVVMLTGREDVVAIERSFKLGANSFATKPINWAALAHMLRYVLRATRTEADLRRQRRRSDELSEMTSNLLSLIRLEARAPLDMIIGYSGCIARQTEGPGDNPHYVDYAEQIGASARHMQERLLDLLQYAQLSSGHASLTPDEYRSRGLMECVATTVRDDLAPRVSVEVEGEDQPVECDRYWLTRALSHLAEDLGARPGVSRIRISFVNGASGEDAFEVAAQRNWRPSEGEPAPLAAYSLERVRIGHGLGLPFARRIAELHGGRLDETEGELGAMMVSLKLPKSRFGKKHSTFGSQERVKVA